MRDGTERRGTTEQRAERRARAAQGDRCGPSGPSREVTVVRHTPTATDSSTSTSKRPVPPQWRAIKCKQLQLRRARWHATLGDARKRSRFVFERPHAVPAPAQGPKPGSTDFRLWWVCRGSVSDFGGCLWCVG